VGTNTKFDVIEGDLTVDERIDKGLELLVVWVLLASAIGLVSALAGHFLPTQVWLASLMLVGIYAWRTHGASAALGVSADWRHLLLLSLICLFFRLPAYHYVLGGQDEGLYVNISQYIERTGSVDVHDDVLNQLKGSSYVGTYLAENRFADNTYVPGVYVPDTNGSRLEFQFYHLFPVWMALFAGIFGSTFGIYALSFSAWLSVIFFYRLALVVSGSRRTALVAGLLLALNPLHAFFSKFPVTEIPTLAFSLMGFTYLAAFWSETNAVRSYRWLWISAACFGALFFTRISGFMYVPFFIALAIASTIMDTQLARRRAASAWALGIVVLYALSVLYGLHWSGQYAGDIYDLSFGRIFQDKWHTDVAIIASIVFAAWFALTLLARSVVTRERMRRYLMEPIRRCIGIIVLLALIVGIFKIYRLGWTDHSAHDDWLNGVWHLAHAGVPAIESSSLYALLVYLGPLLPACFLVMVIRRQSDPRIEFLRLFASGFFVYVAVLQWTVPYGPYYARYLLSELVPYLTLLVVLVWSGMSSTSWKTAIKGMLAISMAYMGLVSAAQLGKSENDGLYGSLKQLLAQVDDSDLVMINRDQAGLPTADEIKTPIVFTFGRNALSVTDNSLTDRGYLAALDAQYDDVYLVSTSAALPPGFDSLGSTRVTDWAYAMTHQYPRKLVLRGNKRLYLSRLSRIVLPFARGQRFDSAGPWNNWLTSGWDEPESWGTWSSSRHAELTIDTRQLPGSTSGLRLQLDTNAFVTANHPRQHIHVFLNEAAVGVYDVEYPKSTLSINVDIPPDTLASSRMIRIGFELPDAVSPKSLGISADERVLALGLTMVTAIRLGSSLPPAPLDSPRPINKKQP